MTRVRRAKKGRSYQEYLDRVSESSAAHFHLEAAWIIYAIFEDRLNSLLRLTGGIPVDKRGRQIRMLGNKLNAVLDRLQSDAELRRATGAGAELKPIGLWKDKRDSLMHSMANDGRPWSDLATEALTLSAEGRAALGRITSAAMRLKRLKSS